MPVRRPRHRLFTLVLSDVNTSSCVLLFKATLFINSCFWGKKMLFLVDRNTTSWHSCQPKISPGLGRYVYFYRLKKSLSVLNPDCEVESEARRRKQRRNAQLERCYDVGIFIKMPRSKIGKSRQGGTARIFKSP